MPLHLGGGLAPPGVVWRMLLPHHISSAEERGRSSRLTGTDRNPGYPLKMLGTQLLNHQLRGHAERLVMKTRRASDVSHLRDLGHGAEAVGQGPLVRDHASQR